jgi:hypothetical protein
MLSLGGKVLCVCLTEVCCFIAEKHQFNDFKCKPIKISLRWTKLYKTFQLLQ